MAGEGTAGPGRLAGKVALLTGAAQGIGAATARLFAQEGARVVLVDLLEEPLRALAEEIGEGVAAHPADVTDEEAVRGVVAATVERFGRLDVAVLNAGIGGPPVPLTDYTAEAFDRIMAVNARAVWLGLKYAMRAMAESGGSIVVTGSTSSIRATPNAVAYVASKHAAVGLMRSAALEGAARNIRVNSVNPATVDTPLVHAMDKLRAEHGRVSAERAIPLKRRGRADEVARLMLFLASDEASFCTGGVYMVDGGVSAGVVP